MRYAANAASAPTGSVEAFCAVSPPPEVVVGDDFSVVSDLFFLSELELEPLSLQAARITANTTRTAAMAENRRNRLDRASALRSGRSGARTFGYGVSVTEVTSQRSLSTLMSSTTAVKVQSTA